MTAGAVGLTMLTLPRAAAATSPAGEPEAAAVVQAFDSAVVYQGSDELIARWGIISTGSDSFPKSAETVASGVGGSLDSSLRYPVYSDFSSAPSDSVGLALDVGYDARGYWWWRNAATAYSSSTGTTLGSALPFVSWSISAPADRRIRLRSFCLHGMGASSSSHRFALTVSTDGYATVLREITGLTSGFWNVVVNLDGVPIVSAASSVQLRLWMFNGGASIGGLNTASNSAGNSRPALDGDRDTYDSRQGAGSVSILGTLLS